jgi:hypothetical protein
VLGSFYKLLKGDESIIKRHAVRQRERRIDRRMQQLAESYVQVYCCATIRWLDGRSWASWFYVTEDDSSLTVTPRSVQTLR